MSADRSEIDFDALSAILDEARVRIDDVVHKLAAGRGIEQLGGKRIRNALDDNNSGCNTACSCGGGGGTRGGRGGGSCVALTER